jgi:hypothetical protein
MISNPGNVATLRMGANFDQLATAGDKRQWEAEQKLVD